MRTIVYIDGFNLYHRQLEQRPWARWLNIKALAENKPWPDALEAFTGTRQMDGSAVLEYFAPLKTWLDAQNVDRECGW